MASYGKKQEAPVQQPKAEVPASIGGIALLYIGLFMTAILGGLIWANIFVWSQVF